MPSVFILNERINCVILEQFESLSLLRPGIVIMSSREVLHENTVNRSAP